MAYAAGIIILLLFIGGVVFPIWVVRRVHHRPKRTFLDDYFITPFELQVPFENIEFKTSDGVNLRGWWMPGKNRNVILGCSGKDGTKDDLIGIGSALWRAGYSVLLFDCRDRGESDSAPRTLGFIERLDAEAAISFAKNRMPDGRIGMLGFSMGAVQTILAAATDEAVQAVVADSPYSSLYALVADRLKAKHIPAQPLMPIVNFWNKVLYGYSLQAVRPVAQVNRIAPRPIMLIHGEKDTLIPLASAQQIYTYAGEPKFFWRVEGADHCGAYFADRKTYMEKVVAFFLDHLGK
ncbi:MAG: alpha/beta hydrolase [Desulfobacterales bacterium]